MAKAVPRSKATSETDTEPADKVAVKSAAKRTVGDADGDAPVAVVKKLLKRVEQKLRGKDVKASLGDYIRLVQLHKELDEETPREIKVTWVEPKGEALKAEKTNEERGLDLGDRKA